MAEVGSIRGGDGSIPGEEEIKEEPQFLASTTRLAILSAMAPTRGEAEIRDLRRLVLAAEPTKTYTIPSQVEPKYTCDVCGNRDQTKFLHESKDGDVVCMGIGDQGCGNVVEEHKLFEDFTKYCHDDSMDLQFQIETGPPHDGCTSEGHPEPPRNKLLK